MDVEQLLRSNFADRAENVHGPRPDLPDAVRTGYRAQRRRRAGTAAGIVAGVLAVGLVLGGAPFLRGQLADGGDAAGPRHETSVEGPVDLYDTATRGSLASDEEFLDRVVQASWDDGLARDPGYPLVPPVETRRVLFAGEVPGGRSWALVAGVVDAGGERTLFAWFTGSGTDDMALTWGPEMAFPDTPMALHDAHAEAGPLVVVTRPGDLVRYALINADGQPVGGYHDVPTTDGVAVGTVPSPSGEVYVQVQVFRDGTPVYGLTPQQFNTGRPSDEVRGTYTLELRKCLYTRGVEVTVHPDGSVSYDSAPADAVPEGGFVTAELECRVELGSE